MPIPKPNKGEKQDKFISRCMSDKLMKKEYPDNKQRYAVCLTSWKKPKMDKLKDIRFEYKGIVFVEAFPSLKRALDGVVFKKFGKNSYVRDFSNNEVIVVQYLDNSPEEMEKFWRMSYEFKNGEVSLGSAYEVDLVTNYEQEMNVTNLIDLVDIELQIEG